MPHGEAAHSLHVPRQRKSQCVRARSTRFPGDQSETPTCHAPRGSSALLACPPPTKKPMRQRSHSSCAAHVLEASEALPFGLTLPPSHECMWNDPNVYRSNSVQLPTSTYRGGARSHTSASGC